MVDAVVEAPFGAHPTSCTPGVRIDLDHLKVYAAATTPEGWRTIAPVSSTSSRRRISRPSAAHPSRRHSTPDLLSRP